MTWPFPNDDQEVHVTCDECGHRIALTTLGRVDVAAVAAGEDTRIVDALFLHTVYGCPAAGITAPRPPHRAWP